MFFSHNFFNSLCNGQRLQFLPGLIFHFPAVSRCTCVFIVLYIRQFFSVSLDQKNLCLYKFLRFSFRKRSSGIKGCIFVIGNPSQVFPHDLSENKVYTLQNLFPAPEIFVQVNSLLLCFFCGITFIFFHEKLRPCQTETIDTLLYISYHEDIFLLVDPPGYCCCQKLLH